MSSGVGCRHGSDPMLLWLWCRPAATAPIRPLPWEPPYAEGAAQEIAKRPKKKSISSLSVPSLCTKSHTQKNNVSVMPGFQLLDHKYNLIFKAFHHIVSFLTSS